MKPGMRILTAFLVCALTSSPGAAQTSVEHGPGDIVKVFSRCDVRNDGQARGTPAKVGNHLSAGQQISCDPAGSLTYLSLGRGIPVRVSVVKPKFHVVPYTPVQIPEPKLNIGGRLAALPREPGEPGEPRLLGNAVALGGGHSSTSGRVNDVLMGAAVGVMVKSDLLKCASPLGHLAIHSLEPPLTTAVVQLIQQQTEHTGCFTWTDSPANAKGKTPNVETTVPDFHLVILPHCSAVVANANAPSVPSGQCENFDVVELTLTENNMRKPIAQTVRTLSNPDRVDALAGAEKSARHLTNSDITSLKSDYDMLVRQAAVTKQQLLQ